MAKFTKTTEIDISAMHDVIEEDTPKKSKWGIIIPIILSVVIAFGVWISATNQSNDTKEMIFEVTVVDSNGISVGENVDVEVIGTYSQLADMKKEYIVVTKTAKGYSDPVLTKEALDIVGNLRLNLVD